MSVLRTAAKAVFTAADAFFPPLEGPRILIYHQVGTNLGRQMEVSTEAFIRQLDWMQEHGEIVDLESAIERRFEPDADRLFVITFDDGYADVYQNAFPVLDVRKVPFVLYLTTGPIESAQPLSHPEALPLTWPQILEMWNTGRVTIGAHTHRHANLRECSPSEIAVELDRSDEIFHRRLGTRPAHFAYPWGHASTTAADQVNARYRTAALGAPIARSVVDLDGRVFHRLPVQRSETHFSFSQRMRSGLRSEELVRRLIRGPLRIPAAG